jgi:hypothetical protein
VNLLQRIVLALGAIIIAGMALFPPWLFIFDPPQYAAEAFHKTTRPAGYHLLFSPHVAEDQTELARVFNLPPKWHDLHSPSHFSVVIDKDRLTVQLGGVLAITVLLTFLLKSKK